MAARDFGESVATANEVTVGCEFLGLHHESLHDRLLQVNLPCGKLPLWIAGGGGGMITEAYKEKRAAKLPNPSSSEMYTPLALIGP